MAVTNQQIIDYLVANPNLTDAQLVKAMENAGISPAQMSSAVGIPEGQIAARVAAVVPPGQSVTLGDTIVQPVHSQTGSGQDAQVGPIENVLTYKTDANQVGGAYQQYTPTGELQRTGTQQKVDSGLKEFALGSAALFGAPYLMNALGGGTAVGADLAGLSGVPEAGLLSGAQGVPLSELLPGASNLATATNVADVVAPEVLGMGTGTGLSTASSALPGATLGEGLLSGSALGAGALGAGALGALSSGAGSAGGSMLGNALAQGAGSAAGSLLGKTIGGAVGTVGNLLQSQTSKEAAQTAAQDITKATQAGVTASQFRPVGMTTRFGTSNFTYDPTTGQMVSAGYQLSPEAKAAQDRLVALAGSGLTQAEQAQKQFAPLQQGATNLFNLGNQYIQQSPEQVAQDYINKQMALLAPTRQTALANLANTLSNTGTTGLSIAQGGNLKAANPVAQAFANAQAMQDLQLAANAQQAGQQNTLFGAGLLGQGSQAMGNYYGGQAAAYQPYTTALGQIQGLETAAQQPLMMGASLGQQSAAAGANAGRLGVTGAVNAGNILTGNAATYNPYAALMTAAGNPNSMFGQVASNWLTGGAPTNTGVAGNPLAVGEYANPGYWT